MRSLPELSRSTDPAFPLIEQWVSEAEIPVELLSPSAKRGDVLHHLQVTTGSSMGAIAYETGGILVDGGWLRLLGSGNQKLRRDIATWNAGRADGFILCGDDVLGGYFAVNGGGLGTDPGAIYYLAPETLQWESLEIGFSTFVQWSFTTQLRYFYDQQGRPDCVADAMSISADQCLNFYPYLWTNEGSLETSSRRPISVHEQWDLNADLRQQLLSLP